MCAIFGFMDYGKKASASVLKNLLRALSIEAECRGTDATGISYVNNGNIVTFKKAKPAHNVKLYFPADTKCLIGHTRMTTQGSEKHNCNNHPFEGKCGRENFSLAHNGVLYNDKELKAKYNLPATEIETDSYVAVQLLEYFGGVNAENIKRMSECVEGSFVFTILRNDNTLFLVKGCNPLTLYHFSELGLYVYASTKSILDNALKKSGMTCKKSEIKVTEGEILQLNPDGTINRSTFEVKENFHLFWNPYSLNSYEFEKEELLLEYCKMFGVSEEDVELLLEYGYDADTIEEMLMDTVMLEEALTEIKIGGR